jgi:hypothetical protein
LPPEPFVPWRAGFASRNQLEDGTWGGLTIPLFAVEMLKRGKAQSRSISCIIEIIGRPSEERDHTEINNKPALLGATGGAVNICLLVNGLNAMV